MAWFSVQHQRFAAWVNHQIRANGISWKATEGDLELQKDSPFLLSHGEVMKAERARVYARVCARTVDKALDHCWYFEAAVDDGDLCKDHRKDNKINKEII